MREVSKTSERYIQRQVILFLRRFGWFVVNTSGSWKAAPGMKGFPDLVASKTGITLYIECKAKGGELRPTQEKFLERLSPHCGDSIFHAVAEATYFDEFINTMRTLYELINFTEPDNFRTWRPKL